MLAIKQEDGVQAGSPDTESRVYTPGVYDIDINDYHSGPGISRSSLIHFQRSPFHYWHNAMNPFKEEKEPVDVIKKVNSLDFGNALHTYILEPDTFFDRYVVLEKVNRATKEGKALYAEIKNFAEQRSLQIICREAFAEIQAMNRSLQSNEDARGLIADALYERSIYWNDPNTDLLCKVRPDIWHSNMIVDLKTCQSASYKDFQRSIIGYGYHVQAGMIQEAIKHVLNEKIKNFVYVAIEKDPPYAVAVYQLEEMAIEHGVAQFRHLIRGVRECIDNNHWPSYESSVINLPSWAINT